MPTCVAFLRAINVSGRFVKMVDLAIGAVSPGRAIVHASATCAGVAWCVSASASSAARMRKPRAFR